MKDLDLCKKIVNILISGNIEETIRKDIDLLLSEGFDYEEIENIIDTGIKLIYNGRCKMEIVYELRYMMQQNMGINVFNI